MSFIVLFLTLFDFSSDLILLYNRGMTIQFKHYETILIVWSQVFKKIDVKDNGAGKNEMQQLHNDAFQTSGSQFLSSGKRFDQRL